ncbi:MAG: polysaccharide deacetylase family protein [Bacteriovorax sp.]|nr:polysaccharide deacetylase family protein [Bacteriovorax sp.]
MKKILFFVLLSTLSLSNAQINFGVEDKDFSKGNIGNIHTGHNEIILTFDDGPVPGVTDKVLDILSEHNIKATFFVIGNNVKANPKLMKRMVDEGHIIGNHSMSHIALQHLDPLTWKDIVNREILDAHSVITPYLVNNKHFYFRAPYAAWDKSFAEFLNENEIGKQYIGPILWDIGGELEVKDGKYLQAADWECWSKKISIDDCMSGYLYEATKRKGGVILMHDLRHQSAELLAKMIPELEDRGFTFSTMNDVNWK